MKMMFRRSFGNALSSAVVGAATIGRTEATTDDAPGTIRDIDRDVIPNADSPFVPRKMAGVTDANIVSDSELEEIKQSLRLEGTLKNIKEELPSSTTLENSVVDKVDGTPLDPSLDLGILDSRRILETSDTEAMDIHDDRELLVDCDSLCGSDRPLVMFDTNMPELVETCLYNPEECPYQATIGCWNTSIVRDMTASFLNLEKFNEYLHCWDTSSVRRMRAMFSGASSFNQPISNWNTANVVDMNGMFFEASSFNQALGDWDTSSVSNMRRMFSYASSFSQPIGTWQTPNLQDMSIMFFGASSFNEPIDEWQVSSVIFYSGMFGRASSFNQCLSAWSNKMRNGVLNWVMFERSGCPYTGAEPGLETGPWCQGAAQQCLAPCYDLDGLPCDGNPTPTDSSGGASGWSSMILVTMAVLSSLLSAT